jgi:hypothetical protein
MVDEKEETTVLFSTAILSKLRPFIVTQGRVLSADITIMRDYQRFYD